MTRATEDSVRASKLARKEKSDALAATRNTGRGNTSHGYLRRGTGKSPYKGSAYSS